VENYRTEPEIEAGDTSDDTGELDDVLNLRLFLDYDGDGWIDPGDKVFFNGLVKNLPSTGFDLKEPIEPNGGVDFVVELTTGGHTVDLTTKRRQTLWKLHSHSSWFKRNKNEFTVSAKTFNSPFLFLTLKIDKVEG
jgi:hypothetical protein